MTRKTPRTAPLPTTYYGDVVFVEYDGKGHPFNVLTRKPSKIRDGFSHDQWDFEWSKHMGCSYFHRSGGGDRIVTLYGVAKGTLRFWAADGVFFENAKGKPVQDPSTLGYVRIPAPLGDPFEGGIDGEADYCAICDDWSSHENRGCRHIFWNDRHGILDGPGADNPTDVSESFDRVIRLTGCARALRKALRAKTWPSVHISAPLIGRDSADVTIAGRDFSAAFDALHDAVVRDVIREGLGWFLGLDAKTKKTNKVVLARLDEIIAEQDARRASGETCYVVRSGWSRRASELLAWKDARDLAKQLRAKGEGRVSVVRKTSNAARKEAA